ncbi:MAG: aldehyde ferredoxin oxidoreductase family protein [Candidatus Hodarchaeales archaeon]
MIKEEIYDPLIKVASIGIAGEKMVKFACITNDRSRQVGRTGLGAVLGSKNLKAIAVRGTKEVTVANADKLIELSSDLIKRCQGPSTEKYRKYGTPTNLLSFNELGCLPTRNFQQATFEQAENVSGEHLFENYLERIVSCCSCPIACDHICKVKSGKYKTPEVGVDYETIYALGPNLGIGDLEAIIKAKELCDRMGIDTMSAGGTIAFAMECYERGILTKQDTDGLELEFGNSDVLIEMVKKIARREGIGNTLAEGSRNAARITGKGSERYAINIKGLELPGYDIRGLKTAALGFGTSTRGGCHLRSGSYGPDIKGTVDRYKEDFTRGQIVKDREDLYTVFDSLILCKFIRSTVTDDELPQLYTFVTGIGMSMKDLLIAGERTYNLERLFNIREGATRKDDLLPQRMYLDPIPDGPAKSSVVSEKGYNEMLDGYYTARGWEMSGIPTNAKLEELDILNQSIK